MIRDRVGLSLLLILGTIAWSLILSQAISGTISATPELGRQAGGAMSEGQRSAIKAFKAGDEKLALKHLRQAERRDPKLPPARVMLASMYFSNGQSPQGRQSLEQAVSELPGDPEPHLIFGDLALGEGRLSDAQALYEKGGRLLRSFAGANERKRSLTIRTFTGLASVAEKRGQFDEARKRWEAVVKSDPDNANAHFRLGIVLFSAGEPKESIAELRKAASMQPDAPSPELTMVALCRQAGKLDEAERWLIKAIKENPDSMQSLVAMARWQLEVRNAAYAAEEYVQKAEGLDPESLEVEMLKGMIAWHRGDQEAAEKRFEAVNLRDPQNVIAACWLSGTLAEQNDANKRGRAWELAKNAVADSNQSPDAIAALGWAAYNLGNFTDAQTYLRAAIAKGAGRDASYYLARAAFRQGHLADSKSALRNALKASGLFIHLKDAKKWNEVISTLESMD